MIKINLWRQARDLCRLGNSVSEIARQLHMDRKTVRKALALEAPPVYSRIRTSSILDPYHDFLTNRVTKDCVTNVVVLKREIEALGYSGGISILRDFIQPLRPAPADDAFMRFETLPGEQAQVDWGTLAAVDLAGNRHRLYCFTMVLGYSRCLYAELTERMDVITLLRCHQHAFDYFGGVTRTILYDNMKQVVLERDEVTKQRHFNPLFLDFSHCYSFIPRLCRPGRPETKGKVESAVKYVKGNFWIGQGTFYVLAASNPDLRVWLDKVANVRIHGTTKEKPFIRLIREQEYLLPLPAVPYDTSLVVSRVVSKDCFIPYQGNRYSVPYGYYRKTVTVRDAGGGQIKVYAEDRMIATHQLSLEHGRMIRNPEHLAGFKSRQPTTAGSARSETDLTRGRPTTWREKLKVPIPIQEIMRQVLEPLIDIEDRSLKLYEQAAREEVAAGEAS